MKDKKLKEYLEQVAAVQRVSYKEVERQWNLLTQDTVYAAFENAQKAWRDFSTAFRKSIRCINSRWKRHPIYTQYEISECGQVRHIENKKIRKQVVHTGRHGYKCLVIHIKFLGKVKKLRVHRLVADVWLENSDPENKDQVDHKDANSFNNHYMNLRWCTHQENQDFKKNIDAIRLRRTYNY